MRRKQFYALMLASAVMLSTSPSIIYAEAPAAEEAYTEETYAEEVYTEEVYTEEVYTEEAYTEEVYTEETSIDTVNESSAEEPASVETSAETAPLEETQIIEETSDLDIFSENTEGAADSEAAANDTDTEESGEEVSTEDSSLIIDELSLRNAVDAAPDYEMTTIYLSSDLYLSDTIVIPENKKISLASYADYSVFRNEGFFGDLFLVEGTLAIQHASEDPYCTNHITVNGDLLEGISYGSLIHVEKNGIFAMDSTALLINNTTSGYGGAIYNSGSTILMGGEITGNSAAAGGAVCNESILSVEGKLSIIGNTSADLFTADNIYNLSSGTFFIDGVLDDSSIIGIHGETEESLPVILMGSGAGTYTLEDAMSHIASDFPSDEPAEPSDILEVPEADLVTEETETDSESANPETAAVLSITDNEPASQSDTNSVPEAVVTPALERIDGPTWTSSSSAEITCITDTDGWYYVGVTEMGDEVPRFDVNLDGVPVKAGESFTITFTDISQDNPVIYVLIKDIENNLSAKKTVELDPNTRPVEKASTDAISVEEVGEEAEEESGEQAREETDEQTGDQSTDETGDQTGNQSTDETGDQTGDQSGDQSTDETGDQSGNQSTDETSDQSTDETGDQTGEVISHPYMPYSSESTIDGLTDGRIEFPAGTYYTFTIFGAGNMMKNPAPQEGDWKWVPIYWQIGDNGEVMEITGESIVNTASATLQLGFDGGLYDTVTPFSLNFILQKYVYTNGEWVIQDGATDTFQYPVTPALLHVPVIPDPNTTEIKALGNYDLAGLLKFYAGYAYPFQVIGAGTDNTDPGEGDVQYIPMSWSIEGEEEERIDFEIIFEDGVYDGPKDILMNISLAKEIYTDGEWQPTEEEVTISYTLHADALTADEPVPEPIIVPDDEDPEDPDDNPDDDIDGDDDVTPIPDPTLEPIISSITDSIVTGLENPLKLTPATYYNFDVIGAGSNLVDPPEGSTRWVKAYWTMDSNNAKQQTSWRIGSASGISSEKTIGIRIYLSEQIYQGGAWVSTGNVQYIKASVLTEAYDASALTPTPTPRTYPGSTGYYDSSGSFVYTAADASTLGVTTTSVQTGDETPIALMLFLALGSMLTAVTLFIRKRIRR